MSRYKLDDVTGLRDIFNQVNQNNQNVRDLGLAGTVDDLIYVRIRGRSENMLSAGAGPRSTWDKIRRKPYKTKSGKMSKTFQAIYELVQEIKPTVTLEQYKKDLRLKKIDVSFNYVDVEDYKTICEIYDKEYVEYKGGRAPPRSDRLEALARREWNDTKVNLNKKIRYDTDKKDSSVGKRPDVSSSSPVKSHSSSSFRTFKS